MGSIFKDLFNNINNNINEEINNSINKGLESYQIGIPGMTYVDNNASLYNVDIDFYENFYDNLYKTDHNTLKKIKTDPNIEAPQYASDILIDSSAETITSDSTSNNTNNIIKKTNSSKSKIFNKISNLIENEDFRNFLNEKKGSNLTDSDNNKNYNPIDTSMSGKLQFKIPNWDYNDYINERDMWVKNISSITDSPGYFYFKIFFDFDVQHGLFGGILNDDNSIQSTNSAIKFLKYGQTYYSKFRNENVEDRIHALEKFVKILSFINKNAPWYFNSIKGLNKANNVNLPFNERNISIGCMNDAIDMRLNSLIELYKFAIYDEMNMKEIIPDNLRKFDMNIIIFAVPIKNYHTQISNSSSKIKAKSLRQSNNIHDFSNVMSYKLFTFKNCEFDLNSMSEIYNNSISNDNPFMLNTVDIKINYDRCYTHTMNEFMEFMVGGDGFYVKSFGDKTQKSRYNLLQQELINGPYDNASKVVNLSEEIIHYAFKDKLDGIKYNYNPLSVSESYRFINGVGEGIPSKYFINKLRNLTSKESQNWLSEVATPSINKFLDVVQNTTNKLTDELLSLF